MKIEKKVVYIIILAIIASAIYFPCLGKRDLWNPNEPNFAEAAREMIESGNYLVPTRNGEPLGLKPAPYYWLIILSSKLTGGLNETAARLPSAVFGLLLVLLTFVFARRIMDDDGAFFSALILATAYKFMWQSRWVETDIVLSFFIALSIYLFFRGMESEEKRRVFYILGYAFAAVATLMKGLVGFIIPGIVIFSYLLVTKNLKKILKMELVWGTLVFLALLLPWYIVAGMQGGGGYMHELVIRQNFVRFFSAFNHEQPFYYFFGVIMGDFAPYSLFIPGALIYAFKTKDRLPPGKMAFFLTWFIAVFVFFSLSDAKRSPYIIPLYPACAVLVGWLIYNWVKDTKLKWYWGDLPAWIFSVSLVVTVISTAVFLINPAGIFSKPYSEIAKNGIDIVTIKNLAIPVIIIVAVWAAVAVSAMILKRRRLFVFATVAFLAVTMLYTQIFVLDAINPLKSPKMISEEIVANLGPDDGLGGYSSSGSFRWYGYLYYTERYMDLFDNPDELKQYYGQQRRVIVIMTEKDFGKLPLEVIEEIKTERSFGVGHRDMVLTSNELF